MATSQAANLVEKAVGHGDNADVTTDISNYNNEYGTENGESIKATVWEGKNNVSIGMAHIGIIRAHVKLILPVEMPKPRVVDSDDVIVRVTGTTICGSDLHLYHGSASCKKFR